MAQIVALCGYAAGMALGQVLFKFASLQVPTDGPFPQRIASLAQNWAFIAALALYLALAVAWVLILRHAPLSRAYPFMALSFALVPVVGGLIFAEPLSWRLLLGIAVILGGLTLVST